MSLEMPQRKDPRVNKPIADANTRRVPKRSAIQPLIGMKTARLNVWLASTDFMLSGATPSACETTGTAVFRIVVSSDSMKNATATSQGRTGLAEPGSEGDGLVMPRVSQVGYGPTPGWRRLKPSRSRIGGAYGSLTKIQRPASLS
jgi:hypothetical protein